MQAGKIERLHSICCISLLVVVHSWVEIGIEPLSHSNEFDIYHTKLGLHLSQLGYQHHMGLP